MLKKKILPADKKNINPFNIVPTTNNINIAYISYYTCNTF